MRVLSKFKGKKSHQPRLTSALMGVMEPMEKRMLFSGNTITAWNFDGLTAGVNYYPAPSTGTGVASSVGMTSAGNGTGPYPLTTVTGEGPDSSAIEYDSGSSDPVTTTPENWKIVGTKNGSNVTNGWNYNAPVGSQGAQFNVSTAGYTNVNLQFDWGVSGFTANGQLAVEYTLNDTASPVVWVDAPSIALGSTTNSGTGSGDTAVMTGSGTNIVSGPYFLDQSNTHGGSNDWQNGLTADFSSVSGANNDANFAVRLVNAATGSSAVVSAAGTGLPSQTSANWRFDDVTILGVPSGSVAPAITTNPVSTLETNGGASVSLVAAANGTPAPTAQWQVSTNGGTTYANVSSGTTVTNSSGGSTYTFSASAGLYRCVFTNVAGSATSTSTTLTVPTSPAVTVNPTSQSVSVPNSVTFSATGFGPTVPTVQWQVSTDGGNTFNNVSFSGGTASYNTATGVATYTFTPLLSNSGDEFEAVFSSNGFTSATTTAATLTVNGAPVTAWTFPITISPPIVGVSPQIGTGTLVPLGMTNDYTGVDSQPVDDVTNSAALLDTSFNENTFRVRGGSGGGSTGSAGSPDGWSGFAPTGTQGLEFSVPTTGYSNIAFHFDWYSTTSGAQSAQLQYTTDGNTWVNYGSPLQAASNDYYGDNSAGAPTGVTLNLQNVTAANNDSNFAIRLVSVYQPTDYTLGTADTDNALPQIYDGNLLITGGNGQPEYHGQYATAALTGGANTSQEIQIGGTNDSGSFQLSIGGLTTPLIPYTNAYSLGGTVSTEAGYIQTALDGLSSAYSKTTVTSLDGLASNYVITFVNPQTGPMTATTNLLTGSYDSDNNTNPGVNVIYSGSIVPYTTSGSGNWRFGNISLTGVSTTGAPGILVEPLSQTVSLPLAGGSTSITLTASAYSETGLTGVQWEYSTDGGNSFNPVASGGTNFNQSATNSNVYNTSYVFTTSSTSQSGIEFEAIFTNGGASATTTAATILVVQPIAPSFSLPGASTGITTSGQPNSASAIAGSSALFTAEVTGLPLASTISLTNGVQWEVSTNNGLSWSNVSTSSTTTITTTIANLASGYQTSTSVLSLPAVQSQSGYEYKAIFTNAAGVATSSPVTLTVLYPESPVVEYTFGGNASSGVVAAPDNTPAADTTASSGVLYDTPYNSSIGNISSLGFNDPNFPSVTADDVTDSAGTLNTNFTANTWRIRGGSTASTPGAPANGWDYLAPEYTQGAELDINTTGLQDVYVSFQWYTTAQGARDLQEQYNTNISNPNGWTNINPLLVAANGGDYYGTTNSTTAPTGALLNLTGITGASNNPNFGIRLVAAWDPYFGYNYTDPSSVQENNQLPTPEPRGEYAAATLVNGNPVPINGSSGNWRFADIVVSGVNLLPAWLSATPSAATWNPFTETLNITGQATIIGNPANYGDTPTITVSGTSAVLDISPTTGRNVSIGGLAITTGATVAMTPTANSNILILPATSFSIDSTSKFDIGKNFVDLQATNATQGSAELAAVQTLIKSGFNNGTWSGNGIFSSTAQTNTLGAVGYIYNNGLYNAANTFDYAIPGTSDVLLRYTYFGDANLDGKVDGSDYSNIDSGFLNQNAFSWINGNFNYDNTIDGSDYTLIDNAFNTQGAQLTAEIASPTSKFASGPVIQSAVPTNMLDTITSTTDDLLKKKQANSWAGTLIDSLDAEIV